MPLRTRWRFPLPAVALAVALAASAPAAQAQAPLAAAKSALDGALFYDITRAELLLRRGDGDSAFDLMLDAARRARSESVYRRAVEIALHARKGDQALIAVRAWRQALPASLEAMRAQLQILAALGRHEDLAEPLAALLAAAPPAERAGMLGGVPRLVERANDRAAVVRQLDAVLARHAEQPDTRLAALVASGRLWDAADDADRALDAARRARAADAAAAAPVLLAIDLMAKRPAAEALVAEYLQQSGADVGVRMAYARALTAGQRLADAAAQLERVTAQQPELAQPWLTLGAVRLELREPAKAEAALERYVALVGQAAPAPDDGDDDDGDDEQAAARAPAGRLTQAWLLLAQAAEQRGDLPASERWLARIDDPRRALEVQTRRAVLLARQGRLDDARELVRRVPERGNTDARAKLLAEASVLREVKRWDEAYAAFERAAERSPDDTDLLYEQAMVAEKLERFTDMERLLRRVMALKPDNAHAHNALGYSFADRGVRLDEARVLVRRALELQPGDPFITDSVGWVEFRLGNLVEAERLLRGAYASRPDAEIGAHLGEVLWAMGRHDDARRIWIESKGRDAANDVLRETLARLKVQL